MLRPLLYLPYTHNWEATTDSNVMIKFGDDTTVGQIAHNDENIYRREVSHLEECAGRTKEPIVDFRKQQREPHPLVTCGSEVERGDTFKYLG